MTEVRIGRMSVAVAHWPEPDEVPTMLEHISADRLQTALQGSPLPEGEWCVRRLDVEVELDPDRPLSALETDWADRIVTALRLSLRDGSQDVVRYLRPEQAVDDLLVGLSTRRYDHAWAWRQVGLLETNEPEPHVDPRAVLLLVLARLTHGRVAAIARLVSSAGAASVDALLGSAGWLRAATLVAAEAGTRWAPTDPTTGSSARSPSADGARVGRHEGQIEALAEAISSFGSLAPTLRVSGLRADGPTVRAWAVLAIGTADPSLLRTAPERLRLLIAAVSERLRPQAGTGPVAARRHQPSTGVPRWSGATPGSGDTTGSRHTFGPTGDPEPADRVTGGSGPGSARAGSAGDTGFAARAVPGTTTRQGPDGDQDLDLVGPSSTVDGPPTGSSSWGGLLFLLNSASDAGLPDLLDRPPFDAHPAPWVLHRLGRALVPVEPDDPALIAFSGLTSDWPQQRASTAERQAVAACVESWITATASRLRPSGAAGDGPTDVELVRRLARRAASIEMEPGWVEVALRLDEVDLDVRRAGLDIDPGWVWWLGCVVRFRYE